MIVMNDWQQQNKDKESSKRFWESKAEEFPYVLVNLALLFWQARNEGEEENKKELCDVNK